MLGGAVEAVPLSMSCSSTWAVIVAFSTSSEPIEKPPKVVPIVSVVVSVRTYLERMVVVTPFLSATSSFSKVLLVEMLKPLATP